MSAPHAIPSPRLATLGLLAILAGCGGTPGGMPASGPVPVTVLTLQAEPVTLQRELPGRVVPYLVAEVRPQVDGIIARRLFEEGGLVQAGQPLYQLDDALYRADQANARAALARAEAGLNTATLEARRMRELVERKLVSQRDDDNAQAALQQAQADVAAARAALERTSILLGYARISSPIGGRIGKSSVTQGALVTARQAEALATVQQIDPVYVDLSQSSAELLELRKALAAGQLEEAARLPVTILLEDGSTYAHEGRLEFSDISVDPSTGSYLLRVVVPNPAQQLLPGVYLRARISTGTRPAALLVPQQGVARDPRGNTSVMVVGAEGKAELRPVSVSHALGDRWLVESGLAAGDRVIIEGLQKVRPGVPLQPEEAGAAPTAPAAGDRG